MKNSTAKHFGIAFSFLTILPFPRTSSAVTEPEDLAASFAFFPLVGFFLGALATGAAYAMQSLPVWLVSVIINAFMALLTRGLHLDGLADLADGIGGAYIAERRLEIMKDSRIGAFGVLALIFAVLLKVVSVGILVKESCWYPIILVPSLSRYAMVVSAYRMPYARKSGGLGRAFLECMNTGHLIVATILPVGLLLAWKVAYSVSGILTIFICVAFMRNLSRRCLGGITGDVLGAINEITEVCLLVVWASLVSI